MEEKDSQEMQTADNQPSEETKSEFKHPHEKYYKSAGRKCGTATAMVLDFGLWCKLLLWIWYSLYIVITDITYVSGLSKWRRDELMPIAIINIFLFVFEHAYAAFVLRWQRKYQRKQCDGTITDEDIFKSMYTYPVYVISVPIVNLFANVIKSSFSENFVFPSVDEPMILAYIIVCSIVVLLYYFDLRAYWKYANVSEVPPAEQKCEDVEESNIEVPGNNVDVPNNNADEPNNIELEESRKRKEKNIENDVVIKERKKNKQKDRKKEKGSSGKSVAIVILSVLLVLSIGACVILFFYARDIEDKRLDLEHKYALVDSKVQGLQHSVYVLSQEVGDTNALEHSLKKHRAFNVLREWIEQNAVPYANGNEYYRIDSPALFIENMPMFVSVSHGVNGDIGVIEVRAALMGEEYIYDATAYFFDSTDNILVNFRQVTADDYRELYVAEKEYKADADYSWMRGKYTLDGETFDSVKDTGMYVSREKSAEYYSLCVKMLIEGLKVFAEEIDDSITSYPGVTDSEDILGCLRLERLS
jgi:hypothetical protein